MNLSSRRCDDDICGKRSPGSLYDATEFIPRRGLRGGHLQTIASHLLRRRNLLPIAERRLFNVEPDVQVLCLCHWQPVRRDALSIILVHGLEGSSESQYVIGTANKAWAAGMNVVRMNVRSCGGTEALAPTLYHSGMSGDIAAVVRELIVQEHLARIAIAGFSMGGNQVLKLAGEWGGGQLGPAPQQVHAVAAVSPAMDLSASADALHAPSNRIYEWRFLQSLRSRLARKSRLFPDRFQVSQRWWKSIRDFDDKVTAPIAGFLDAEDYYQRASSSRVLDRIVVPTLVIQAQDDPFIRVLPDTRAKLLANPCIEYVETGQGGHCGFLSEARDGNDGRWAEQQIINFVLEQEKRVGR